MKPNDPLDADADLSEDFLDENYVDQDLADDATYDQDLADDDNWEDDALPGPVARPKKKTSLLTLLLVGGAVILGGGFIAYQLVKPAGPAATVPMETTAAQAPVDPSATQDLVALQQQGTDTSVPAGTTPVAPADAQKGFMDDPTQLQQPATDASGTQTPTLSDSGAQPAATTDSAAPVVAGDTGTAAPALPNIDLIKKAGPSDMTAGETPAAQTDTVALSEDAATKSPAPVDEAASKPDDAAKQNQMAEKEVKPAEDVSETVIKTLPEVTKTQSDNAALSQAAPNSDLTSGSTAAVSQSTVSTDQKPVEPVSPRVRKPVAAKAKYAGKPASTSTGKWELRGAYAGEAMIGRKGQAFYKTARVGETVESVGEIQSISQVGGKWIVKGTKGTLSQ